MKPLIEHYLKILPQLTKEESDLIETICNWSNEDRTAFKLSKKIFEEELEDDKME